MQVVKVLSPRMALAALFLIAATYAVNAMDRIVFPVLLPHVAPQYGFSLAIGGLLATIFTLGLGITGIFGGFLFDRMSRKSIAVIGIVIYSVCTMLTCVSIGFLDMALYRAVSGVGEALQNAAIFTMAGAYFARNRTLAFGILNIAYGIGSFIGPRWAVSLLGSSGSWHTPLYVYGIVGLIGAAVVQLTVPKSFTEKHMEFEPAGGNNESHIPDRLFNRNILIMAVACVCTGLATFGYLGLYPSFLISQLHFTTRQAGAAASMYGIGAMMALLGGYLADRINQKYLTLFALVLFAVSGYVLFNVVTTPLGQNFWSFVEGTAASGFLYVSNYSLTQRCVRSSRVGYASGIVVTCVYLPAAFSGLIFAKLRNAFGWGDAALVLLSLQLAVPFILMMFFKLEQTSFPKRATISAADVQIA